MLVNGKEVNHLIIGGETFTSENIFPAYYDFPQLPTKTDFKRYDIKRNAKNNGFEFEQYPINYDSQSHIMSKNVLVYNEIISLGSKYILVKTVESVCTSPVVSTAIWVEDYIAWCKLSELGGVMIPATGGGK